MQGLRGEMDRLESALLKHIIKSTVHTSESEYRGQIRAMEEYLTVLETRAIMEKIDLD